MGIVIIPILTALGVQILKLSVDKIKGNLDLKRIWDSYGGMPSSHAAFVACLATMAGYQEGWSSAAFAIALVLAILTVRDAMGFRYEIGVHSKILNRLVREHPQAQAKTYPLLSERWGHTPSQIIVGSLIGIIVGMLAQLF
ncbi:divergent PAP2 family protein [Candidatus Parcubacteria bacterium]|jgi:acid phosphatase family membrane protein YuiD|nr:MAG: divergent PAP2 family protein [Candidatus Parcubacteria bacterium]